MKRIFYMTFVAALIATATDTVWSRTSADIVLTYDFSKGKRGWKADFADYPADNPESLNLEAGLRPLPVELEESGTGFYIAGTNTSDDLFMFLKKKVRSKQLEPLQRYLVKFKITFASAAPSNCIGIGGAPGESVYLKAGAINERPTLYIDSLGWLRTDFDKGNQSQGGEDVKVVSNIANGIPCEESTGQFKTLTKTLTNAGTVTTGKDGAIWLIVGTDSGFEGRTELYFQKIKVYLEKI